VATGVVVGGVLLAGDQLLRVEQLAVGARAHLIDDGRFQIDEDTARHVLAGTGLAEERIERIVTTTDRLVRRHLTVRLDTVLQAVQLPARIADLDTGLPDVNGNDFTHVWLRG
jgi:hypothetical protein